MTMPSYVPGMPCPCGCKATGAKLSFKSGHIARACECMSCRNRRNQQKGRRAQTKGHQALGGIGVSPANEEAHGGYDVRLQVEHKAGRAVPQSIRAFLSSEWFRHALGQADRARRVGDGSMPAVMIDGRWIVADAKRDQETPA